MTTRSLNSASFAATRLSTLFTALLVVLLTTVAACSGSNISAKGDEFVIASYNIRHGAGNDDLVDIARTGRAIQALGADIVALQEVDRGVERSGSTDEPELLGKQLGMNPAFGAFFPYQGGEYGIAILSRFPIARVDELQLPEGNEPRIALSAEIELPSGRHIRVVSVHFDWVQNDSFRYAQAETLKAILDTVSLPMVLLGDFNDQPGSRTLALFTQSFTPAVKPDSDHFTFPSTRPDQELDHIMFAPSSAWEPAQARIVTDTLTSDHRPVVTVARLR